MDKEYITNSIDGNWESYPLGTSITQKANQMSFQYDYHPASNIYRHIQQKKYNAKDITLESLEQNFFDDDIWKPSYWRMWFNNNYCEIIKDNYTHLSSQIQIVVSKYVYVELYKEMSNFNTTESLAAKKIFQQNIYENDLSNEITVQIDYNENHLTITHYLNDSNELVTKSNAAYLEIFEYVQINKKGALLLSHKYHRNE